MADLITIKLTPIEAALIWRLVDAQADAGACKGGNTPKEEETLDALSDKLRRHHSKFRGSFRELSEVGQ